MGIIAGWQQSFRVGLSRDPTGAPLTENDTPDTLKNRLESQYQTRYLDNSYRADNWPKPFLPYGHAKTWGHGFFVEVPQNYNKPLPDGYEIADLPSCTYLYFNGMPFDDPKDFPLAIGILNEAIENYPFARFGWKQSENAPVLGMGAEADTGARTAVPVERV